MIILVTKYKEYYEKSFNTKLYTDIRIFNEVEGLEVFRNKVRGKTRVCLDVEATGLDPHLHQVVGLGIKVSDYKFIFDYEVTKLHSVEILSLLKKKLVIGQNLKYDMKMLHNNNRVVFNKVYDTMIAEQRLFMGTKDSKSLASLTAKYCGESMAKDERITFVGVNPETFRFTIGQVRYLVGDLVYLEQIRDKQRKLIRQFSMEFLINGIEFPLLEAVANAELEGFEVDKDLWLENVTKEEEHNYQILCELDEIFRKLRDKCTYERGRFLPIISSNKFNNPRAKPDIFGNINKKKVYVQEDLFGEISATAFKTKAKVYANNINWTSPKEVQYIAGSLGIALPTDFSSEIPSIGVNSFKLIKSTNYFKLGKNRLVEYLENTTLDDDVRRFLELIKDLNASTTSLGTFGRSFLEKRNKVTGKFHTIFRTCSANTGRFQSGGGRFETDKYNAQNIPAKLGYRIPFSADKTKYNILTADYSGAELIVMASHAQDFKLIELSKGDMHTHMGNKMYRAVYGHRARNLYNTVNSNRAAYTPFQIQTLSKEYKDYVDKAKNYVIDPSMRKGCKPMTFGSIYGMYGKKAEATMEGLHKGEGDIAIGAIKEEIPRTFKMVEDASAFAKRNGYVIHNTRTNSRRWFPVLVDLNNHLLDERQNFRIIAKELSEARNTRIQGTQADFVKEATVVVNKHIKKCKLKDGAEPIILSWVHDEFVIAIPINTVLAQPYKYEDAVFTDLVDLIKDLLVRVANRYLNNVTIAADTQIEQTWVK